MNNAYTAKLTAFKREQNNFMLARSRRQDLQNQLIAARTTEQAATTALSSIQGAPAIIPTPPISLTATASGAILTASGGCGTVILG